MSQRFHPVSLHVIRGALSYAGFEVGKIRQQNPPFDPDRSRAYTVEIRSIKGIAQEQCPPSVVRQAARGCFSDDVDVTTVKFDGTAWTLCITTWVVENDPATTLRDMLGSDAPSAGSDIPAMEVRS